MLDLDLACMKLAVGVQETCIMGCTWLIRWWELGIEGSSSSWAYCPPNCGYQMQVLDIALECMELAVEEKGICNVHGFQGSGIEGSSSSWAYYPKMADIECLHSIFLQYA